MMDLNRLISNLLRAGVLASAFLSVIGLVVWASTGLNNLSAISGSSFAGTIASAITGDASGLIYLGVALLVATPVVRVAMSTLYFARERDGRYVLITVVVLAMLLFALVSGSSA